MHFALRFPTHLAVTASTRVVVSFQTYRDRRSSDPCLEQCNLVAECACTAGGGVAMADGGLFGTKMEGGLLAFRIKNLDTGESVHVKNTPVLVDESKLNTFGPDDDDVDHVSDPGNAGAPSGDQVGSSTYDSRSATSMRHRPSLVGPHPLVCMYARACVCLLTATPSILGYRSRSAGPSRAAIRKVASSRCEPCTRRVLGLPVMCDVWRCGCWWYRRM